MKTLVRSLAPDRYAAPQHGGLIFMKRVGLSALLLLNASASALSQDVLAVFSSGVMDFVGWSDYDRTSQVGLVYPVEVGIRFAPSESRVAIHSSLAFVQYTQDIGGIRLGYTLSSGVFRSGSKITRGLWSGSVGLQWQLFTTGRGPFLGLDLLFGKLGGSSHTWSTPDGDHSNHMSGKLGIGSAIKAGLSFTFLYDSQLELAARYADHTMFLRPEGVGRIRTIQVSATFVLSLWTAQNHQ